MHARAVLPLLLLAAACGACGGSASANAPNTAAYLTVVKTPTLGTAVPGDDSTLLGYGHRACRDLDAGERSDAVVTDLASDALPGSAAFNSYALVAAAAAKYLCPQHESAFAGDPSSFTP